MPATEKKKSEIITPQLLNECVSVDYKVQELVVPSSGRTSYVKHNTRHVFLSVLSGECVIITDGLDTDLIPGKCMSIPRKTKYMFVNEGETDFRFLFTEYGSIANSSDIEDCDETKIPRRYRLEE